MLSLPRAVAQEFQLAAALAPVACADVSAPYADRLFATDASEAKGAVVSAPLPEHLRSILWATADRKGAYARICSPAQALLRRADPMFEETVGSSLPAPERPLAYLFDFLAVGSRAELVLKEVSGRGWSCGPLVSSRASPHYCLGLPRVLDWIFYLIDEDRVRGTYIAEPLQANLASFRHALATLLKARPADVACMIEAPLSLRDRALKLWSGALELSGVSECTASLCAFGAPYLKKLRFIASGCDLTALAKECSCQAPHSAVRGAAAKPGFVPRSGLQACVAGVFHNALRSRAACLREADLKIDGLERLAPSDLALSLDWSIDQVWRWKGQVHINILEASALARLFTALAVRGGPLRFVNLCDSHVARAAVSKGRSASPGLRHATRRASTVALAAGLYHGGMYCPTRLIPADNPTRDKVFEPPVCSLGPSFWTEDRLLQDASRPRLRRWAANWARLVFALSPSIADLHLQPDCGRYASLPFRAFSRPLAFDSTFGFPGEGPSGPSWISGLIVRLLLPLSFLPLSGSRLQGFVWVWSVARPVAAMEAARARKTEMQRKESRAGTCLERGRPMLATTRSRREKLRDLFEKWLSHRGRTWNGLLSLARYDVEQLNEVFIWYGQWLYTEGRPYYHLSETINSFSVACPQVRRQLQPAWDICFAWQRQEPPTHHAAMPWQILMGLLSIAMLWGWMDVAGILAICWGGLARVGEAMAARRRDLVLPEDVGEECGADGSMILMAVMEPKTRFKAARHQCLKVDQPQLVRLIRQAFQHLGADEKLWPKSGATLRARFQKLLTAIGIRANAVANVRDFDLASLRAGGATWLMGSSESPGLVRRRGRWVTLRVMEIYVQEVAAMMYLPRLEPELRQHIFDWANVFDEALDYVSWCQALGILPKAWLFLLQQGALHA